MVRKAMTPSCFLLKLVRFQSDKTQFKTAIIIDNKVSRVIYETRLRFVSKISDQMTARLRSSMYTVRNKRISCYIATSTTQPCKLAILLHDSSPATGQS